MQEKKWLVWIVYCFVTGTLIWVFQLTIMTMMHKCDTHQQTLIIKLLMWSEIFFYTYDKNKINKLFPFHWLIAV